MLYAVRFSPTTTNSTVHSADCPCAFGKSKGYTLEVKAETPEEARTLARRQEQMDERNLPSTRIARCAR